MSYSRIITSIIALMLLITAVYFLTGSHVYWTGKTTYLFYIILALYFFALLVSNQQANEDIVARIERISGSILFSYILFIQLIYAPVARYIFSSLIQRQFFLSDMLAILLFLFFIFFLGTGAVILNSFSRFGFLSNWFIINNSLAYYVLRGLWPVTVIITIFLYLQAPFVIIAS
jgi:hypothetical protein